MPFGCCRLNVIVMPIYLKRKLSIWKQTFLLNLTSAELIFISISHFQWLDVLQQVITIYCWRMNLVNSKVIKSSRPIINRSIETLYIESFKISYRGYVYFLWTSNHSQIHSLRYESTGKLIQVKETLTISLRITSKNGRDQPSITYLKLMAQTGEELDEFEIPMNTLNSQFKEMEIPMDRGLINIKIRRKAMNIGEEEINFQGGFYRSMAHRNDQKSMANMVSGEYQSLQEELSRTKKELEDEVYLNNKLKNDRDVLLATKQELQLEIQTMIMQITKEISILREHYDSRMSIRQHCYQEEIEDLVNLFNSNADQSKRTVEMILKQKIKLEDEMKPLAEKLKNLQIQINHKNVDYARLSEEKIHIQIRLGQIEESGMYKDREIQALHLEKSHLQQQISSHKLHEEHLNGQINNKNDVIEGLKGTIKDLQKRANDFELLLHAKDEQIFQLEGKIIQYQQKDRSHESQRQLFQKQIVLLQQEKKGFLAQIEALHGRLEQSEYEMQFNENVMGQLKKQQTQKEEELYSQLQALEKLYSQKMEDIINNFQREKDEFQIITHSLEQQKAELLHRINELQGNVKDSEIRLNQMDHQLNHLSNQIRNTQGTAEEKDETIRKLMKQIERLNAEVEHLKSPAFDKKRSQKKIQGVEGSGKHDEVDLQKLHKELAEKNNALQAEIKRLSALLDKNGKQFEKLREEKQALQDEMVKKIDDRSIKSLKQSKRKSQHEIENILKNGSLNQDEVIEIVHQKQRQISQLRHRVDYLQNLYQSLQTKLDEIAKKYPDIDIAALAVPKPQQWCDSEQQQQKCLNNVTQGNNNLDTTSLKHRISRRDSIGAAIMEKDEDALSNPSAKINNERKSQEPRSQQKIGDGYRRGVIRKQSSAAGRVTIEVPRGTSIRREPSHGSYDASERSGSYIKVSHSKKIRELEEEVKMLSDKVKQYETQMEGYVKNIDSLKRQLENTKHTMEKRPIVHQTKKQNKESQVVIEDEGIKRFMHQSQMKEFQVQKMNLRLGQLEENLKNQKAEGLKKINILESRLADYDKRMQENNRRYDALNEINRNLQKLNEQLEQKLRRQKQAAQEVRITIKQLQMHLQNAQNQLKKLKSQNETLEDRVQKMMGSEAVIKQLSRQLDDYNKKGLDQTRIINHLKLQKDAVEEQLRLLKKRQNDHIRIATQWEEKAASLQRAIEEQKRKEGKFKRQIDQVHEELRRSKLNTKKAEQELQSLNSSQITWQAERRKHLDEISSLQDQISRKDYEFNKLNKEIEKWKARAEEKQQLRMGKKSELRQQIDRLESQLIRKQKKLLEQTEQNKLLRGRLQLLQRQNKRIMEQKNQSYGQKLKYYVDQMSNIKKLLQEYQNQNSRLKIDNNELYEQLEILRMNYDKLQMKYDQNIQREQSILNDLQAYINETNVLKDRLGQAHTELDQAQSAFVNIRKQIDDEKLQSRRLSQKYETSQRNLERALVQIRDLKIRISEYQTNNEINGKMGERYRALQRKKNQLEDQYRKIKSEYDNLVNVFVYKREDLEKAVNETRAQQRRLKDDQVQKISEQCSKTISAKTQRLQQQILDLYNENSRLRNQNQSLMEENGRQKGKLLEFQMINQRFGSLQNENENFRYAIDDLKEELRKKNEKIGKMDISIQAIEAQCNTKQRNLIAAKNRMQQLEKMIQNLNNQISTRKNTERQLQEAVTNAGKSKERQKSEQQFHYKQKEAQLIQQYQAKIRSFEQQIQKLKEREAKSIEEHTLKMKKLEEKMDEMEEALRERQKAIQTNYEADVQQLQNSLLRLSQDLEEKMMRIDELNQAILILEDENKDLTKQIQDLKYQFEEERQILDGQLTRLKNKLKQAETTYAANLKSLQDEVFRNAQKTNVSGSRVKTNEAEDRIAKRYEEKLKNKDRKIDELKQNIYALEETIVKLRKKQSGYESTLSEVERLKISIIQFEKQRKNIEAKYEDELNRNADTIRQLKRQILLTKENEDRLRLLSQQKIFQNESISSQLKTMRGLYQQLQRQLEKRKNNLTAQLEEQSSIQLQLRMRQSKILQLQERLMESLKYNKQFEIDVKKKGLEVKKYIQMIHQFQKKEQKYVEDIARLTNELAYAKKSSQQLNAASQLNKSQISKMRNELTRLRKNQQELKVACASKQEAAKQLKRLYDDLSNRYKQADQLSQKYTIINERSRQLMGYGIQQIIDRFLIHLEEKDTEINQLIQEVEELKFLNERKYLDYDELKKENFQLQIKVEDLDVLNDQLQTLRKICDKLEEEKKNSVFREEVLRMQLQNLANAGAPDLRSRIQAILSNETAPSYSNFSFYNL